jgi:hypothetical protein
VTSDFSSDFNGYAAWPAIPSKVLFEYVISYMLQCWFVHDRFGCRPFEDYHSCAKIHHSICLRLQMYWDNCFLQVWGSSSVEIVLHVHLIFGVRRA